MNSYIHYKRLNRVVFYKNLNPVLEDMSINWKLNPYDKVNLQDIELFPVYAKTAFNKVLQYLVFNLLFIALVQLGLYGIAYITQEVQWLLYLYFIIWTLISVALGIAFANLIWVLFTLKLMLRENVTDIKSYITLIEMYRRKLI